MIWRNAVPVPWPRSVLPTKNVAVLSWRITIHESSCRKSGSGYGPAACAQRRRGRLECDRRDRRDADDEHARRLDEVAAVLMRAHPRHRLGREPARRRLHAVIRHAAAQRALHALANLRVGGVRVLVEQRLGGEDLPVLAEAALRHLLVDPRLLHRMQPAVLRQAFERRDLGALHLRHRPDARPHRLALDQHGARAALAEAAAEARTRQVEIVAQDVEQRRGGLHVHRVRLAVDPQGDGSHEGNNTRGAEQMADRRSRTSIGYRHKRPAARI